MPDINNVSLTTPRLHALVTSEPVLQFPTPIPPLRTERYPYVDDRRLHLLLNPAQLGPGTVGSRP